MQWVSILWRVESTSSALLYARRTTKYEMKQT